MHKLQAFIRLSRLHFLLGGILMCVLGTVTADDVNWRNYIAAQLLVTFAQLTAHYANEYGDYEADKSIVNRTSFSGGSGVLTSGLLHPRVALQAGVVTSGLAVLSACAMVFISGYAAALGLVALFISWAYSVPPFRWLSTGAGEAATSLTVTCLVPLIGMFAQGSTFADQLAGACVALFLLHTAMLLAFELPDIETDRKAGKFVLAVRLGVPATFRLMVILVAAAAVAIILASTLTAMVGVAVAVVMLVSARRNQHGLTTLAAVASFFVTGLGMLFAVS